MMKDLVDKNFESKDHEVQLDVLDEESHECYEVADGLTMNFKSKYHEVQLDVDDPHRHEGLEEAGII